MASGGLLCVSDVDIRTFGSFSVPLIQDSGVSFKLLLHLSSLILQTLLLPPLILLIFQVSGNRRTLTNSLDFVYS